MRSTYSYEFKDGVHVIIDQDKGRSVTNDAEMVIRDLRRSNIDLTLPVIYRDSMGQYDRMLVRNDKFVDFAPLRTRDLKMAITLVRRIAELGGNA
jgi:lipopolysaccharide biosynthesis regulator YciM